MDASIIKNAIAKLRELQGDDVATRRYLLDFVRKGLQSGSSLQHTLTTLAIGPDSVLRRAWYSEHEERRWIEFLKSRALVDIFADEAGQSH